MRLLECSASTVSTRQPEGLVAWQLVPRVRQDTISLAIVNGDWASWRRNSSASPFPTEAKHGSMRRLVDTWLAGDEDEQVETLEQLRRGVSESGLSARPRF